MFLLADALPMLRSQLTRDAEILDDHGSNRFQELARRWSDGDIKIPGAMVLPSNEVDCQTVVSCLMPSTRHRADCPPCR